jgi:hypothetical protein
LLKEPYVATVVPGQRGERGDGVVDDHAGKSGVP